MERDAIEQEANAFALALLMPEEWLRRDVKAMGTIDIVDDVKVGKLAKKYQVSIALMTFRLGQIFGGSPIANPPETGVKKCAGRFLRPPALDQGEMCM